MYRDGRDESGPIWFYICFLYTLFWQIHMLSDFKKRQKDEIRKFDFAIVYGT